MFTQCPECSTVFRVTAAVLRAAQGQVRCGVCDANFDALRFLTDSVEGEVPPTAPHTPAFEDEDADAEPVASRAPAPEPARPAATPSPSAPPYAPRPAPASPAPTPAPPPAPPPAVPAPARAAATRTTPSADEDRALAEIAAVLARDAAATEAQRKAVTAPARPPPPPPPEDTDDDEVNVLEPSDVENIVLGAEAAASQISDKALEFDVPPGEWDRVFVADEAADTITPLDINLSDLAPAPTDVASEVSAAERLLSLIDAPAVPVAQAPRAATAAPPEPADDPLARTDSFEKLELDDVGARVEDAPLRGESALEADVEVDVDLSEAEAGAAHVEDTWFDASPAHTPAAEAPVVAPPPVATAASAPSPPAVFDREPAFALPPPDDELIAVRERPAPAPVRRRALAGGIALLALALLAQLVHFNREALAATEPLGGPLKALYARLGVPIEPRWNLAGYDVKQWGAATDNAPGSLRLRASVVNRAQRAQPYPLLRVTLEDRFGAKVARREFTPAEYLPGHIAPTTLLAPGARADADLSLADPGSQAVGFELDVCLPHGGVLNCGTEPKAAGNP